MELGKLKFGSIIGRMLHLIEKVALLVLRLKSNRAIGVS